jgi:MBOAT, membrane-bound O-acyltransferase family
VRRLGRRRISFERYLSFRLGSNGGLSAWFNFFIKPFGAKSFAEFWRLWNPVYGYFLYYFSYRPLVQVLPRPLAMLLTFAACGFLLHDLPTWAFSRRVLPPGATIAFVLFAVGAIASDTWRMDLSGSPFWLRGVVNIAYLGGCVGAMVLVIRLILH